MNNALTPAEKRFIQLVADLLLREHYETLKKLRDA